MLAFFSFSPTRSATFNQSGQVGVIILLIMTVLLTVGLSVASRSTQDLYLSQQTAESARVFNAAEAGVEQALSSDFGFAESEFSGSLANNTIENVNVNYVVRKVNELETRVFEGDTVTVDVVGVTTGQSLRVEWSKENDCTQSGTREPASLLVSVYSDSSGATVARSYALGACNNGGAGDRSDGFNGTSPASGPAVSHVDSDGYRRRAIVDLQTGDLFVRIKPIYNDTHVRVTSNSLGWTLPVQYFNIRSQAQSSIGNETRTVEVNRTLPTAPSVMDFALYSGTTILKTN